MKRLLILFLVGCGSAVPAPPVLGDPMSSPDQVVDGEGGVDCTIAREGCPCTDVGSMAFCGMVYRISHNSSEGMTVDCAKGYATCLSNDAGVAAYGKCEGPTIFMGD